MLCVACPHQEDFAGFPSLLSSYCLKILPVFKQPEIICTGLSWGWRRVHPPFLLALPYSHGFKLPAKHCFSSVHWDWIPLGPSRIYSVVSVGRWDFVDSVEKLLSYSSFPRGGGNLNPTWSGCKQKNPVLPRAKLSVETVHQTFGNRLLPFFLFFPFFPFFKVLAIKLNEDGEMAQPFLPLWNLSHSSKRSCSFICWGWGF